MLWNDWSRPHGNKWSPETVLHLRVEPIDSQDPSHVCLHLRLRACVRLQSKNQYPVSFHNTQFKTTLKKVIIQDFLTQLSLVLSTLCRHSPRLPGSSWRWIWKGRQHFILLFHSTGRSEKPGWQQACRSSFWLLVHGSRPWASSHKSLVPPGRRHLGCALLDLSPPVQDPQNQVVVLKGSWPSNVQVLRTHRRGILSENATSRTESSANGKSFERLLMSQKCLVVPRFPWLFTFRDDILWLSGGCIFGCPLHLLYLLLEIGLLEFIQFMDCYVHLEYILIWDINSIP